MLGREIITVFFSEDNTDKGSAQCGQNVEILVSVKPSAKENKHWALRG